MVFASVAATVVMMIEVHSDDVAVSIAVNAYDVGHLLTHCVCR